MKNTEHISYAFPTKALAMEHGRRVYAANLRNPMFESVRVVKNESGCWEVRATPLPEHHLNFAR